MTALSEIEWEDCLLEPQRNAELERWARSELGRPSAVVRYFAPVPWLLRAIVHIETVPLARVSPDLADLAMLVGSRENACRFCYAAIRTLLRVMGVPDARIERLEENLLTAELNEHDKLGLDFVRRLSHCNPPPTRADKKALREVGFSEAEIRELAFIAVWIGAANRATTLGALPPAGIERLQQSWFLPLMRPILRRLLARARRRGEPEPLPDDCKSGPFSDVVRGLDGLPAARTLHRILDEAWASSELTTRAKALVFAVIARGLGSAPCERESRRLLSEQGLTEPQIDEILAHLDSPVLDPVESAILPFARETLWYDPAPIQRLGKQVQSVLTPVQFLELIGLTAFANAVCRLAFVVTEEH